MAYALVIYYKKEESKSLVSKHYQYGKALESAIENRLLFNTKKIPDAPVETSTFVTIAEFTKYDVRIYRYGHGYWMGVKRFVTLREIIYSRKL